jgi:PGF-pre-PGF domain-containing protein
MVRKLRTRRAIALSRLLVVAVTLTVVWAGATPLTIGVASAAPIPITQCTDITQPGHYVFTNDIIDSTSSATDPCIGILTSDVHIDGAGHTLDGTWTGGGLVQYGIALPAFGSGVSVSNVTVSNLRLTDLGIAIQIGAATDFEITNNTFTSTPGGALTTAIQSNTNFFTPVTDGVIADNRMLGVRNGITSNGFDANVTIERNEIVLDSQGSAGISAGSSAAVTIDSNVVDASAATSATGIRVTERSSSPAGANIVSNNVVTGAKTGIYASPVSNTVTTSLADNVVSDSTDADFVNRGSESVTVTNLTLDTATVSFQAQNVMLRAVDPAPTPPTGLVDIGQVLEAGSYSGTTPSLLALTFEYDDAAVASVDESQLELYEYNESLSTWTVQPSTVVVTANTVTATLTDLPQAQFFDFDTFETIIDYETIYAPLATIGPTVGIGTSGDTTTVAVTGATAGEPVSIPIDDPVTENVTLDSITVTTSVDTDYTLNVTTNETAPTGTTELTIAGPGGTVEFGYIDVDESLLEAEIQEVVFEFRVDADALAAAGIAPDDVALFRYNATTGLVDELPTTNLGLDTGTNAYKYVAVSPGLSVFGIGGLAPNIVVTDASVDETELLVGENVTVTANVTNDGGVAGSETLNLTVDGTAVDTTTVSLDAGASTTVAFEYQFTSAGTYAIAVNGVPAGTVLVKLPVDVDVQPADELNVLPTGDRAAVPVAILGSESCDPPTEHRESTHRLGWGVAVAVGDAASPFATDVVDVDGDGNLDLVVLFRMSETGLQSGETTAALTGLMTDGLTIYGTDDVVVQEGGNGRANR